MPVALVFAILLGLCAGSFLNVVIYRLPIGESIAHPPSRCPGCGSAVAPYDNVPVLSWLLLRGRCRNCREPISGRYPLVEALTAALAVTVVLVEGADRDVWIGLAFVLILVPITFIDLDLQIIPDKITAPAAVLALVILALTHPHQIPAHLAYGAGAFLFLFLAVLAYPGGMGMGDVKLAGVMGLYLGRSVIPALIVALLAGTVFGIAIMARRGVAAGRKTKVPFGPFLALGGVVGLLAGSPMIHWYLHSFT
jgi:leader peptidase (prepilin peptidase)/N-methyltransferase